MYFTGILPEFLDASHENIASPLMSPSIYNMAELIDLFLWSKAGNCRNSDVTKDTAWNNWPVFVKVCRSLWVLISISRADPCLVCWFSVITFLLFYLRERSIEVIRKI